MKARLLLCGMCFLVFVTLRGQTIATGPVANGICVGTFTNVGFTITGNFNPGNVFSAELSDATGSFTSPVVIGNTPGTGSGSITAQIPLSTLNGNLYRIRVVSTNPPVIGTDNGSNLSIYELPVANAGPDQCTFYGSSTTLYGSASGGMGGPYFYNWSPGSFSTQNVVTPFLYANTTYTLSVVDATTGCMSLPDAVQISIATSPMLTWIDSLRACPNGTLLVPIRVKSFCNINGFTLTFNIPNSTAYIGFQNASPQLNSGLNVTPSGNVIVLNWFNGSNPASIPDDDTLIIIDLSLGSILPVNLTWNTPGCSYTYLGGPVPATFINGYVSAYSNVVITSQPVDTTVLSPAAAHFRVVADPATPTAYQWQVTTNGSTWNNLSNSAAYSGVTSATLNVLSPVMSMNGYRYRCRLILCQNPVVTSSVATLHVIPANSVVTTLGAYAGCTGNISIPLQVQYLNNCNSIALKIDIDTAILHYTGFGNVNPSITGVFVGLSGTSVLINWFSATPINLANALLLELHFSGTVGISGVSFDTLGGNCHYISTINGNLPGYYISSQANVLQCASISGIITYKNNAGTPLGNMQVNLMQNGLPVQQTFTDNNGLYLFTGLPNGSYSVEPACTKPWGGVNASDALAIMKHFVGMTLLTGLNLAAADVNASGGINSVDALMALQRFTGQISSFQAGDWIFEPGMVNITNNGIYTIDLKGLCFGDVNGSYTP